MNENYYNVGLRAAEGEGYSAGIAYIIIPSDINRAKYITECFRTSTVSIFSEHNGVNNRVPVDIMTLNFIVFPLETNSFGSAVSFLLDPVHKTPIVLSVYNTQGQLSGLKENQFRIKRQLNTKFVEISGSPDGSYLGLNVKTDKGGQVFIKIDSDDKSGELNVSVAGNINLTSLGNTTIKQHGKLSLVTIDPSNKDEFATFEQNSSKHEFFDKEHNIDTGICNINADEEHKINSKKVSINDGQEPFILGNKLKKFLDDFIDTVSKSTVTTSLGQMPLLNATQIAAYRQRTKELLSQVGFIDK